MMFVWWLIKRAWEPVVRKWDIPATEDKFSGKVEYFDKQQDESEGE